MKKLDEYSSDTLQAALEYDDVQILLYCLQNSILLCSMHPLRRIPWMGSVTRGLLSLHNQSKSYMMQ